MLQARVPDVLALDEEHDVLPDVLRVVGDPFERARAPDHVEHLGDASRVFHHVGHELAHARGVLEVDRLVLARDGDRRLDVEPRERIEGLVDHLLDVPAEVAHPRVTHPPRRVAGEPYRGPSDLLRLVPHALEVGDRLDDRDDEPKITRRGLAEGEDPRALLVDLDLEAVDLVVVPDHPLADLAVELRECGERARDLLLDEPAHREHRGADFFQLLVVLPGDVPAGHRRPFGFRDYHARPLLRPALFSYCPARSRRHRSG